jgi:GNAT superfamily N-acetyltransferase
MNAMLPAPLPEIKVGECSGVTFWQSTFSQLRAEGLPLFLLHWAEASADRSVPLAVDWECFKALERIDAELCIAVRRDGKLIGYAVYLIHTHLHYQGYRVAEADVFFLHEEDREGWIGIKLFQIAEELLRARGVDEVWQRAKLHVKPGRGRSDLGPLFRYLGYRPVETVYRKRLS